MLAGKCRIQHLRENAVVSSKALTLRGNCPYYFDTMVDLLALHVSFLPVDV
jgi:hypothetical protein